jgi:putative heme iron utilization protein
MAEDKRTIEEVLAENAALKKENAEFVDSLAEAHEAIGEAEEKVPGNPVLTIDKQKYELVIPRAKYPKGKHEFVIITAELLKKEAKLAAQLVKDKWVGLVKVNPKD